MQYTYFELVRVRSRAPVHGFCRAIRQNDPHCELYKSYDTSSQAARPKLAVIAVETKVIQKILNSDDFPICRGG